MKANRLWVSLVIVLSMLAGGLHAQQRKPDLKEHEQKVKDIVAFLEYVLNTIGNANTSTRDKDVLIKESYTKIFRDAKVQVEDDLVEKRNVITNKDVQAYLKDVDFFYEDVKFEFTIKDIKGSVNANDKLFYKVSLLRNIKGTTSEGKAVNSTIPRYVEINYDPKDQDLKIVSIYTNEFNEKGALLNWWKALSFEWQSIFKRKLNISTDSVQLSDIKNIISVQSLDLSQNRYIQNIEPLGQLIDLQTLNLSNTSVADLSPIRNLTGLMELNISNTKVDDITALKYADNLVRLNMSNSLVTDISILEKMSKLEELELQQSQVANFVPISKLQQLKFLNLEGTKIINLSPVTALTNLDHLNVSRTFIDDLTPLANLKTLTTLNLDSTLVTEIIVVKGLENLKVLYINNTSVSNLRPLEGLKNLERIYCDNTPIDRMVASTFMTSHPEVLVIFDSEDLKGWWNTLPDAWKNVFSRTANVQLDPSKEELAKVTNIDSINVANNAAIGDLRPLQYLQKLQVIVASKTAVTDLSPLEEHREIRKLDISDTPVEDIAVVREFSKLKVFKADNTRIQNLNDLAGISSLQKIYVDGTIVDNSQVQAFLKRRPSCLLVYKSAELNVWWNELPDEWKQIFLTQIPINPVSRIEDLHRLVELESVHFKDVRVSDLSPLLAFVRLRALDFSGTAISDLSPLASLEASLTSLHATNSPLRDLTPLGTLAIMEDIDLSNTPVESLKPLGNLENLKTLNCSGTQVKSLDALDYLIALESLDCSNTRVKKINAIESLPLKTLKCYNTKISSRTISKFKRDHPECNVVYY